MNYDGVKANVCWGSPPIYTGERGAHVDSTIMQHGI